MKKLSLILFAIFLAANVLASNKAINGIYYDFDKSSRQATVTYKGKSFDKYQNEYQGSIEIPSTVVYNGVIYQVSSISDGAFRGCKNLKNVTIPKSVNHIGMFAFKDTGIDANPHYWDNGVLYIGNCIVDAKYDQVPTYVEVRSDTRLIADYAFAECEYMKSIHLPKNLLYIGKMAFALCTSLENIDIPANITQIEELSFWACINLRRVQLPKSISAIASGAFGGCIRLDSISLDSVNESYSIKDGVLFSKDMTTLVCYPAGLKQMTYTIPVSVRQIASYSFEAAINLEYVVLPQGLKIIRKGAFMGCESLKEVSVNKELSLIEEDAFSRCVQLMVLRIPKATKLENKIGEPSLKIERIK